MTNSTPTPNRPQTAKSPSTARESLRVMRVIWGAMLVGQFVFLVVVFVLARPGSVTEDVRRTLSIAAWVLIGLSIPGAILIRRALLGPDRPVGPQKLLTANIAGQAILEGAVLAALVMALVSGTPWPFAAAAILGIAAQAVQFPRGDELA